MQAFTVVTPVDKATRLEIETAVYSFDRFFKSLTGKHRRCSRLILIESGERLADIIRLVRSVDLEEVCQIILQKNAAITAGAQTGSSVLFMPVVSPGLDWISNSQEAGLPVVGFEGELQKFLLDDSCAMLAPVRLMEENIQTFSGILKMLYFDPGALLMLSRGSLRNFKSVLPVRQELYLTKVA